MIRNGFYDLLKINEFESKGKLFEAYCSKFVYYGLSGAFFGSICTIFALRRFKLGMICGFGYGLGLLNHDLLHLFRVTFKDYLSLPTSDYCLKCSQTNQKEEHPIDRKENSTEHKENHSIKIEDNPKNI